MLHEIHRTERFRVSGVEVLRCRITLPGWEEYETLSGFYRELGERALGYCQRVLYPWAEAVYDASEDARKRFHFSPFLYDLTGEVCSQEDGLVSVRITARLSRRGGGEPLASGLDAHTWQLGEGAATLLPPEQVVERRTGRRLSRRRWHRAKGALLEDGQVLLCMGDRWEAIPGAEEAELEGESS